MYMYTYFFFFLPFFLPFFLSSFLAFFFLPGVSFLSDRAKVLTVGHSLCKALVDVAAQSSQETNGNGSLRSTLVCCELSQLLVRVRVDFDLFIFHSMY